jgi:hypothetical protein
MDKLVKPNPKKGKKKKRKQQQQQQRKASRNLLFPNLHPKTAPHKLCQITNKGTKTLFSTSYERSNSASTRIAHEKTKRGSIEEEENVPTKIQKNPRHKTHSLTHSLPPKGLPKEFTIQQRHFTSTSYGSSILIFAEYKREKSLKRKRRADVLEKKSINPRK